MIWILLVALGIPLWMIAGTLIATALSRRSFKRKPGVFPTKLRAVSADVEDAKHTWPRRRCYARWVHDVLLVHRGLALVRTDALPIAHAMGSIGLADAAEVRGLGENALLVRLVLDSGAEVQFAAPTEFRDTMVGPFFAAPPSSAGVP